MIFSSHLLVLKPDAPRLIDRSLRPLRVCRLALGLVLMASAVSAQGLAVYGFSPTSGAEETLVNVTGAGFAADPSDQWAFVHNGVAGYGVVIDPVAGDESSWTGVLGAAPGPFTGTLTVWKGVRWELPSVVVAGESGGYLVSRAEWFVRSESADGPGTFTVTNTSPGTIGSFEQGDAVAVAIDFSSLTDPTRIDLNVTIDGGSDTNTGGGGQDLTRGLKQQRNGGGNPSRALRLEIHNVEPIAATPEAVARDVGSMLTQIYGPFGLRVSVQGAKLYIIWKGATTVERAFAVLHWESH